jgi:hypothetical protein
VVWSATQLPSRNSLYVIDFNSGNVKSQILLNDRRMESPKSWNDSFFRKKSFIKEHKNMN